MSHPFGCLVILALLTVFICCNANYGWLKKGKAKGSTVLINEHDKSVELVYNQDTERWQRAIGSTGIDHFASVGDTLFKHRYANYFEDETKKKNCMAMWYADNNGGHKAKFKWVYKGENEEEGENFVKAHSHDIFDFNRYITGVEAKVQQGCTGNDWIKGPPVFGWMTTNDCVNAIKNPHQTPPTDGVIIMKTWDGVNWLLIDKGQMFEHLSHQYFINENGKNVQFMYNDASGEVLVSEEASTVTEAFAIAHGTKNEYEQYIVEQMTKPPKDDYKQKQRLNNKCAVIAINNFAGYKLFDYDKEKKVVEQKCEEEKTKLKRQKKWKQMSNDRQKFIDEGIESCVAQWFGDDGVSDGLFTSLLDRAGWRHEKMQKYGGPKSPWIPIKMDAQFKEWKEDDNLLGFFLEFSRYGGFGAAHWVAIRKLWPKLDFTNKKKPEVKWKKIDGAGTLHGTFKAVGGVAYIARHYYDKKSPFSISKHDKTVSETFTTKQFYDYIYGKYTENKEAVARYHRWKKLGGDAWKNRLKHIKTAPEYRRPGLMEIRRGDGVNAMDNDYGDDLLQQETAIGESIHNNYNDKYNHDHELIWINVVYVIIVYIFIGFTVCCAMFVCGFCTGYWMDAILDAIKEKVQAV